VQLISLQCHLFPPGFAVMPKALQRVIGLLLTNY
jgi:hypothetical protein